MCGKLTESLILIISHFGVMILMVVVVVVVAMMRVMTMAMLETKTTTKQHSNNKSNKIDNILERTGGCLNHPGQTLGHLGL